MISLDGGELPFTKLVELGDCDVYVDDGEGVLRLRRHRDAQAITLEADEVDELWRALNAPDWTRDVQ